MAKGKIITGGYLQYYCFKKKEEQAFKAFIKLRKECRLLKKNYKG